MSAYVLYSCGCSLDVSAPCRLTQLLTARNCSLHAPAPLMQLRMQLRMQLLAARSCSLHAAAHATTHFMHRSVDATAHFIQPLTCSNCSLHASGGLHGRQELELLTPGARRMLVCVTDFVLSLGQLLRETSKRGRRWNEECSLGRGCVVLERGFGHTA